MEGAEFVTYIFLFAVTATAMLTYYGRIRKASREYTKARTVLGDIVLSFKTDLQTQERRVKDVEQRSEKTWADSRLIAQIVNLEVEDIQKEVVELKKTEQTIVEKCRAIEQKIDKMVVGRIEVADVPQAESLRQQSEISLTQGGPLMHIRRDRAVAGLTETELRILHVLADDGEKTGTQIRYVIHLTREHTARLMKKLYASGYIERDTRTMPYMYRIKKEMKELLR
jgi:hypothetical protein